MVTSRRVLMALAVLATTGFAAPSLTSTAWAGNNEPQPYTQEAFDAAQKAGRPILIDTFATWCDICKRQAPIIEKLLQEPKYKDLVTLRVNFDTQRDVMRKFKAQVQSTLIVFRGSKEAGRSVGDTQPEWIEDLMDKAVEKGTSS